MTCDTEVVTMATFNCTLRGQWTRTCKNTFIRILFLFRDSYIFHATADTLKLSRFVFGVAPFEWSRARLKQFVEVIYTKRKRNFLFNICII